jgi:hypothetical protein
MSGGADHRKEPSSSHPNKPQKYRINRPRRLSYNWRKPNVYGHRCHRRIGHDIMPPTFYDRRHKNVFEKASVKSSQKYPVQSWWVLDGDHDKGHLYKMVSVTFCQNNLNMEITWNYSRHCIAIFMCIYTEMYINLIWTCISNIPHLTHTSIDNNTYKLTSWKNTVTSAWNCRRFLTTGKVKDLVGSAWTGTP